MSSEVGGPPCKWQPAGEGDFPRELRFIFVQMLFSLTAAEIARQLSVIFLDPLPLSYDKWPAYSHLALAAVVVVTSWVGWSASEASRKVGPAVSVFGVPFLILLTDVGLVILYFILVRGAEVPKEGKVPSPSAEVEAVAIAWIFAIYFVWDLLTKAGARADGEQRPLRARLIAGSLWRRAWISMLCMVLGIIAWFFLHTATSISGVLSADAALLCLVLFFRALKEIKHPAPSADDGRKGVKEQVTPEVLRANSFRQKLAGAFIIGGAVLTLASWYLR